MSDEYRGMLVLSLTQRKMFACVDLIRKSSIPKWIFRLSLPNSYNDKAKGFNLLTEWSLQDFLATLCHLSSFGIWQMKNYL